MIKTIKPSPLLGEVDAIASKSDVHRNLICAGASMGETEILSNISSRDMDATASALRSLGASVTYDCGAFRVTGARHFAEKAAIDCSESGSTLRFILPVAAAVCPLVSFSGSGRLPMRPIDDLVDAMASHGVEFSSKKLPFKTQGQLCGGDFEIAGNVSSQYISGLLMALPLCGGGSVSLTTNLESAAYVDITVRAMAKFGVKVEKTEHGWSVPQKKYVSPKRIIADGDWSNAAFFLAAGALGEGVAVKGLDMDSPQGDKEIVDILRRFGASVATDGKTVRVSRGKFSGCRIDLKNVPDLLPILAVVASFSEGETRFYGGARLRIKESDRLSSVCTMINALGGNCEEREDGLIVRGTGGLCGGSVDSANDHRIAMAAAIAAAFSSGGCEIVGADAVAKSYPRFYDDFNSLGGRADGI